MITNKNITKYNVKVDCDLEYLNEKLLNICYKNTKSYYKLNIYMIPDKTDILKITDLSELESYIIIQDFNGENKQIIHKSNNIEKACKIEDIFAMKELLKKLNYNELMYINYDIYSYNKQDCYIKVKNVLKQGIFVEGDNNLLNILDELNISYDISNLCFDNEKIALENVKQHIRDTI